MSFTYYPRCAGCLRRAPEDAFYRGWSQTGHVLVVKTNGRSYKATACWCRACATKPKKKPALSPGCVRIIGEA